MRRSIVGTLLASSAAALLAGACSFTFGSSHTVSKSDVEGQISSKFLDSGGGKPSSVTCPNDLDAKVGAKITCSMKVKDQPYLVDVTVTTVNGNDVKFDMQEKIGKDQVQQLITAKMSDSSGNKPDSVTCPGDLTGRVGAEVNCQMKIKGTSYNVNATVSSVNGNEITPDIVETVDKNQVANTISQKLTEQVGRKPDSVTCPDNLKGAEGATLRCQLTDGSQTFGVNVTVTAVQGADVNFNIQVDDQPS
jgi:predicted thioesterase